MNLLKSANGFDEFSQLAEMSQHLKNTACGYCGGKKNRLMTITIVSGLFYFGPGAPVGFFIFSSPISVCPKCESRLAFFPQKHPQIGTK